MAKPQKSSEKKSAVAKTASKAAKKTNSTASRASAKKAPAKAAATTAGAKAPAKKAAPAKAAPAKAAPAKAAPAKPEPPALAQAAASVKAPAERAAAKVVPVDPAYARAHPDAKLSKTEVSTLFHRLVEEKKRVLGNFERHVDDALADEDLLADEIDIAQRSTDQAWLFRMADKDRKLLIEIDGALEKMRNGDYGVCEGTDEAIGYKRLELRPWTRYSVAYKELLEREKAQQAR